jgi:hypothetical protein
MSAFKPVKDQNKPKRPMTSFLYFLEEYRESKKPDGLKGPEVSKRAGEVWRSMSDEKKKKYHDMQEKAKLKFDQEMKEYVAKVKMVHLNIFPSFIVVLLSNIPPMER